ncbi:hypothetical protein DW263_13090 [Segatella copri]|uniref:Uncharacterized protein n=2 Tax=Segatella copri TaxID=165179 RepID=A0A3R6GL54_9BACT|nr:hypothetical protein DW263_13090 [Segatella copri]RHG68497.1 hypothetical protein DW250_02685 [Segatella copri]
MRFSWWFREKTYLWQQIAIKEFKRRTIMDTLDKEFWEKREAAMKRFMAAKERKKARVAEITKSLCEEYKERTGVYPKYINVW